MDPLWILLIGMAVVVGGILAFRLHAFLALVLGALVVGTLTPTVALERYAESKGMSAAATEKFVGKTIGERIAEGFGSTATKVGILIGMAAIIGKCLLDSGAADRVVRSTMRLLGERMAPGAFLGSGFLLGIPVFFDTVFYLMIPLGKALRLRTGRNYLLYILSITAGGTMAHSLVPPTPGPLFVAAEFKVDLGVMILMGCGVGFFTAGCAFLFALVINRFIEIPLRESAEMSLADLEKLSQRDDRELPSLWLSLAPILLPVLLIAGATVVKGLLDDPPLWLADHPEYLPDWLVKSVMTLGNKNIALIIAASIAMGTLVRQRKTTGEELKSAVQDALASGGVIILITSAGGAFGQILQQTGISQRIGELSNDYEIGLLPMAFLVTMFVRTAQGSATVAMITAAGIFSGMVADGVAAGTLDFHPVYVALAIGCGSKPIAWMNDSGFWVICKMSGMTESEALRTITPMSIIMGVVGITVILIAANVFPMV